MKCLLSAVALLGVVCCAVHAKFSPILIIPGNSGSQLSVLDANDGDCNTNGEAISIWLNVTHVATKPHCYSSQLRLDIEKGYSDPPGVTVLASGFGSTSSVEFLSPDIPYLNGLVEYFVQRGYTRDVDIRAAPYDWRLAPKQLSQRGYYSALKDLVEQMYTDNGNTKVTLVVHSMGGPVSLHFLANIVPQEWKDTYINSYVPLGAAFGGANLATSILTSGPLTKAEETNPLFDIFKFIATHISTQASTDQQRTHPGLYWLSPKASTAGDTIIISTPTKNYTADDYQQLFADIGYPQGYAQLNDNPLEFPAPKVSTYCFYGLEFPTPETFVYDNGLTEEPTSIEHGDGDILVNKASLEVCEHWSDSGYPFNRTVFENIDHFNVTTADVVLKAIGRIVGAPEEPISVCLLRADPGPCSETVERYYFNTDTGTCETFTYGGCAGNGNNFESLEECTKECDMKQNLKKTEL